MKLLKTVSPLIIAAILIAATFLSLGVSPTEAAPLTDFTVTAPAVTGTVNISPRTTYLFTATGFAPSASITFKIGTRTMGTGVANGSGTLARSLEVPLVNSTFGAKTITAEATNGDSATYAASIVPVISLSVVQGSAGASIKIGGDGFSAGEVVTVTFASAASITSTLCVQSGSAVSTTLGTPTSNSGGSITLDATVPAVAAGSYSVVAIGTSSSTCAVQ